jgi:hypothetical protein
MTPFDRAPADDPEIDALNHIDAQQLAPLSDQSSEAGC